MCFLTRPCQDHSVTVEGSARESDSFILHLCSLGLCPVKVTQVTSLWVVHLGQVSLHTVALRTTEEAHPLMSTRWRSSSRRHKRCPGDLAIEASCPSLAQLEMPARMLIQTAVKQLPGHGKTLTVPEKTANGCNNFPHLIKIKHFFPQLRGRKGAGADWQEGDRTWHLSKSPPKGLGSVKTYVDSAVQCCRKWAVTAISPGLAQSVPVAFHAENKPRSPDRFLGWLCLFCNGCQHTPLGSELKNKSPRMGTGSRSSCPFRL